MSSQPGTDQGAAEAIANEMLRDYGTEYDTSHLTVEDFRQPAQRILSALAEAGYTVVKTPDGYEYGFVYDDCTIGSLETLAAPDETKTKQ